MEREYIIQKLKERGCRITRQRLILLDIILEEECSSCKEIYYRASGIDNKIGAATVYRMINTLEEIGALNRRNMYKISCEEDIEKKKAACTIQFKDNTVLKLSEQKWCQIIQSGLQACGYTNKAGVKSVTAVSCNV
ncbi:MAG: transcriptional repressor [Lachnospiraceae bacterium]|nr:transcriptional repressor [Lachnospiraceae bacterium]